MSELNFVAGDQQSQHLVAELREERSAVWRMYCQIAEARSLFDTESIRPLLSNFSQLLIDYVSLGHFGVYQYLLANPLRMPAAASVAEQLYPLFSSTTASAIVFNDQYDNARRKFRTDNLAQDLSVLGENLAKRMELEDYLCSMLTH